MLAEARDSQRMSDLDSVKSAINLYLATTTSTPTLGIIARSTANATCGFGTCTVTAVYTVAGGGWVEVDFTKASGGSPLATLPRDPINGTCGATVCQYAYKGDNTNKTFELDAVLESAKYSPKMLNTADGGNSDSYYEIGSAPGLAL